jgi:hypothetical protein
MDKNLKIKTVRVFALGQPVADSWDRPRKDDCFGANVRHVQL